jgi:hypothetical protein
MLERDKQKAIKIIVDQKAEEQTPESPDGDPPGISAHENRPANSN